LPGVNDVIHQRVALQFLIKFGHAFAGKIVAAAAEHDLSVFQSNQWPDVMQGTGPGFKILFYGRVVHGKDNLVDSL